MCNIDFPIEKFYDRIQENAEERGILYGKETGYRDQREHARREW